MSEKTKKSSIFAIGIIFLLILMPFSSAVGARSWSYSSSSSNPQYYKPNNFQSFSQRQAYDYWPILKESDKCEATSDFMMFIRPGGCSPRVVRSDLLEEQNVPVFCKVDVIKLNPLVDVTRLKSVKFKGESNPYIAGISFHPNREAIREYRGVLDKPLLNDAGYVVVLLKRQQSEETMPDSVKTNITAVLRYDMENVIGAGQNQYYLDVLEDNEWKLNYRDFGFWKGKGYLKADWIDVDKAEISIYRDSDERLVSFTLNKGETSRVYYMPGFYCKAGIQIRLNDIGAGVERALLNVDGEKIWLVDGERFLNGECKVVDIEVSDGETEEGVYEDRVKINCMGRIRELVYKREVINVDEKVTEAEEEEDKLEDKDIDPKIRENFDDAQNAVNNLIGDYGKVSSGEGEYRVIWAAKALYELAQLAEKIGLKKTAKDLYEKLKEYEGYQYIAEEEVRNIDSASLGYREHFIQLIQVKAPSKEEASAEFELQRTNNVGDPVEGINIPSQIQETDKFGPKDEFELIKLYPDRVKLKYDSKTFDIDEGKAELLPLGCESNDEPNCEYKLILKNINFKEMAKVSLIPKIPNEYSEADFTFEIGIEKRAIKLTPEKVEERIENLDKSIEKFEKTVENLGQLVKGMKTACLATSSYLVIKNFFLNLGGGATARQEVMPIYYNLCKKELGGDVSESKLNACLEKYNKNNQIDRDINSYAETYEQFNEELESIQKRHTDDSGYVKSKEVAKELRDRYDSILDGVKGADSAGLTEIRDYIFYS